MLPYALRIRLKRWRAKRYLKPAAKLPPLEVPTEGFKAEVHMMLSRHDLLRGVAALQTFFHHSGLADRVGVMFHLDGSVSPGQRQWLEEHVHGAAFTDFPCDDPRVCAIFEHRPFCEDYYRRRVSCMTRLVHIPAFARADRAIQLDSDVAFFDYPEDIVRWVDDPTTPPLFQVDSRHLDGPPALVGETFDEIVAPLRANGQDFWFKDYYLSGGLMLFSASRFSFDIVEHYLRWQHEHRDDPITHDPVLFWFWEWTVEQTAFLLNFSAWQNGTPLGPEYAIGLSQQHTVCNHFLSSGFFLPASLARVRSALWTIARKPALAG